MFVLSSILLLGVWPTFVQQVQVKPDEQAKEAPYISRNITATRDAFGLSDVGVVPFDYQENLNAESIVENASTVENARLWDPYETLRNFQSFQSLQTLYKFSDVDVDRYPIGGKTTQVMVSARELNRADLPSQSWVNRQLVYTHGFGAVGIAPPWYQLTVIAGRQLLAGCSKCASIFTGVTSALNASPFASTAVGRPASMAFHARSMVWAPMSPTWPQPKSQNMFH